MKTDETIVVDNEIARRRARQKALRVLAEHHRTEYAELYRKYTVEYGVVVKYSNRLCIGERSAE